jgi:protein-disulfide isomerase
MEDGMCDYTGGTASCSDVTNASDCFHKVCLTKVGGTKECSDWPGPGLSKCPTASCPLSTAALHLQSGSSLAFAESASNSSDPRAVLDPRTGLDPRAMLGLPPENTTSRKEALRVRKILATASNPTFGSYNAPVKIALFQDLKCGMCAHAFRELYEELRRAYIDTGKITITFYEYPLIVREPELSLAAAVKCAHEQDAYIEMLRVIYNDTKQSDDINFASYASASGINGDLFKACLARGDSRKAVQNDLEIGRKLKITGTPQFYVNGRSVPGAVPYIKLKAIIEQEIEKIFPTM